MTMRYAAIPLLATALNLGPAHAAAPNMREGMWEITTKMEMTGKSGVEMPQQMVRHCLTRKDVEDPRRTTPSAAGQGSRCKMTDYKLQGNTATWKMACEGEGAMTGTGTVTYSGDSYSGNQTMAMKRSGQVMNMKMDYSGRRVGDCPKQ
jgi:hypothetical protein